MNAATMDAVALWVGRGVIWLSIASVIGALFILTITTISWLVLRHCQEAYRRMCAPGDLRLAQQWANAGKPVWTNTREGHRVVTSMIPTEEPPP